jgi:type IV secretion system protein VirD4
MHEPAEKRNLIRVAQLASSPEIYPWCKRICSITTNEHVKQMLGSFATGVPGERTLEGILETLRDNVSFFDEPAMVNCLTKSTFQFRELRERLCTVAITVPVHRADHGGRFLRLKLSSALGQLLTPGRGKRRVLIICDDFYTYGSLPAIENAQSIAREFGVTIWVVLQDLSQLSGRYPRTWQTFLSNAGVRTFMTPQDEMTAEYVSKQCGFSQIVTTTPSVGPQPGGPRVTWSKSISKQELMLPHQTREMARDRMLLFVRGLSPILARKIPYYKTSLKRRARPNPFYDDGGSLKKIFGR